MMKLSNDISILTVALTIQKIHSSEKYSFKSQDLMPHAVDILWQPLLTTQLKKLDYFKK